MSICIYLCVRVCEAALNGLLRPRAQQRQTQCRSEVWQRHMRARVGLEAFVNFLAFGKVVYRVEYYVTMVDCTIFLINGK